ncbi:MAG: transketolase [Nitrospinota bacterium]
MEAVSDSKKLLKIANSLRIDILRMISKAGSGHPGGSLSAIDVLTALYYAKMDHSPSYQDEQRRDRFVLSKGHGAPALYAILASCGYFAKEELNSLRKLEGTLSGHPSSRLTHGVEVSTGSLGQGLSIANGMAISGKLDGWPNTVYCMLGDGELQEGQVWEALMSAAHYKLDNIVAIIDANGLQIDGSVENVMGVEPIDDKIASFGWAVKSIDGHNFDMILDALDWASEVQDRPAMIVSRTIKGRGVSFMEGKVNYHGVALGDEELAMAIAELER